MLHYTGSKSQGRLWTKYLQLQGYYCLLVLLKTQLEIFKHCYYCSIDDKLCIWLSCLYNLFILYSYLIVEIVEFDIFQLKSVISQNTFEKPIILKLQFLKELIFTSIKIILMFILPKVHQHFVTILIMNKNWMCSRWLFYFYLEHCQWLVITGIIRHLVPGLRTVTKRSLLDWRSRSWCWRCDCDGWSVGCVIRSSKQPPWNLTQMGLQCKNYKRISVVLKFKLGNFRDANASAYLTKYLFIWKIELIIVH